MSYFYRIQQQSKFISDYICMAQWNQTFATVLLLSVQCTIYFMNSFVVILQSIILEISFTLICLSQSSCALILKRQEERVQVLFEWFKMEYSENMSLAVFFFGQSYGKNFLTIIWITEFKIFCFSTKLNFSDQSRK